MLDSFRESQRMNLVADPSSNADQEVRYCGDGRDPDEPIGRSGHPALAQRMHCAPSLMQ